MYWLDLKISIWGPSWTVCMLYEYLILTLEQSFAICSKSSSFWKCEAYAAEISRRERNAQTACLEKKMLTTEQTKIEKKKIKTVGMSPTKGRKKKQTQNNYQSPTKVVNFLLCPHEISEEKI